MKSEKCCVIAKILAFFSSQNNIWGVITPEEAYAKIEEQKKAAGITEPRNLEEQAISLVGTDIYEKLVKGYTKKQWGRPCNELPQEYRKLADKEEKVIFGGRLAEYKYYDMDAVMDSALKVADEIL